MIRQKRAILAFTLQGSLFCLSGDFSRCYEKKFYQSFMIIVSLFIERVGVKMLKINFALNFFEKIFGNILKIN